MSRLQWCDSTTAVAPPRIKVERFGGRTRRRVHLLGEVRCIKTHHKQDENTVPCLEPEECPFCAQQHLWKIRFEHFAPALMMDTRANVWVHIVAIFTPGGWNQIRSKPVGAHRGRLLDVWRRQQGNAQGGVLAVEELARIEPQVPAFDIEPHLLRLWYPNDTSLPPAVIPAPLPYVPGDEPRPPVQTAPLSDEQRRLARLKMDEWKGRLGAVPHQPAGTEVTPAAAAPEVAPAPIASGEDDSPAEVTALTGKKAGGLLATEVINDPANYGPKQRVVGGDGGEPLVTPAAQRAMKANRLKQLDAQNRADELRKVQDGTGISDRLTSLTDQIDAITNTLAPSANGKHATGKGGGK